MDRKPTPDEAAGIAWWNGLPQTDREHWLVRGGAAAVADAWKAYQQSEQRQVRVIVELSDTEAWNLAQFLKRVGYSDFRAKAQDDSEAFGMRDASERVRSALAEAGYSPR